jgi:hypothetical protein
MLSNIRLLLPLLQFTPRALANWRQSGQTGFAVLTFGYVAAPVTHFISLEVRNLIETVCRISSLASLWH